MGIRFIFSELINLTTNEDLLKKSNPAIQLIELSDLNLTLEIHHPTMNNLKVGINNSMALHLSVHTELESIILNLICSVLKIENFHENSRIELRLTQFNKKDWDHFLKILNNKQESLTSLLKQMKGE